MRHSVSIDQSHAVMARLQTNVDWEKVDSQEAQFFVKQPRQAGDLFTEFLRQAQYYTPYLRPSSERLHYLRKTNGDGIIALDTSEFVKIDPIFETFPFISKSEERPMRWMLPHMLMKSGRGDEIFRPYGFGAIAFTQDQVLTMMFSGRHFLVPEARHLFPCIVMEELHVICVDVDAEGRKSISAKRLGDCYVYPAGCQVLLLTSVM